MKEFDLHKNSVNLKSYIWEVDSPTSIVLIIHGLAEHAKRYDRFAQDLNKANIIACSMDLRGHGGSIDDGQGYFCKEGWQEIVADISALYAYITELYPDVPVILFGHSMGSIFARCVISMNEDKYIKCILSGVTLSQKGLRDVAPVMAGLFALFSKKKPSKILDSLTFSAFNKAFTNPRTDFDWLSRDNDEVDKYVDDEKCGFIASASMFRDMAKALLFTIKQSSIDNISKELEILIISGEKDPCGNNGVDARILDGMYKNVNIKVTTNIYESARHELLNETNREIVSQDIIGFINKVVYD